jgi:hypothetical protein
LGARWLGLYFDTQWSRFGFIDVADWTAAAGFGSRRRRFRCVEGV